MTDSAQARYESLYRKSFDAFVRRISREVGHSAAEDIVARSFVKLWHQIEGGFADDLGARLNTIIDSETKNHWRTERRRRKNEIPVGGMDELADIEARQYAETKHTALTVPLPSSEDIEFRHDFDLALRELDEDERDAFILTELRGLTLTEAAAELDTSHTTVRRRAELARAHLREELS